MKVTTNDKRVLEAIDDSCKRHDGYMPHGSAAWTAVGRLQKAGLIQSIGFARCRDCAGTHEGDAFVRTREHDAEKPYDA